VLETLRDARRFLAPGGVLVPQSLEQWAAPVVSDRFDRDLSTWRNVGFGLDWSDAERITRNNMYVYAIEPADLLESAPPAVWDTLTFAGNIHSRRGGKATWTVAADATIFGFAIWWECTLVPGVVLLTSPHAPRTHWDQIYLPLLEPLEARASDEIALEISSETGGDEAGIAVQWAVEQCRGRAKLGRQTLGIGEGYLPHPPT
jgi:protein arginine N-methyltransferase 1